MSINDSYNEEAIVEAIAVALDNFYTNLIKKVDSLNIKAVMKRKNPYLFRAKAMNGAAQIMVPSRFMRKIVCRLRLNEVSRQ